MADRQLTGWFNCKDQSNASHQVGMEHQSCESD